MTDEEEICEFSTEVRFGAGCYVQGCTELPLGEVRVGGSAAKSVIVLCRMHAYTLALEIESS